VATFKRHVVHSPIKPRRFTRPDARRGVGANGRRSRPGGNETLICRKQRLRRLSSANRFLSDLTQQSISTINFQFFFVSRFKF
jgi:hypothetical protein